MTLRVAVTILAALCIITSSSPLLLAQMVGKPDPEESRRARDAEIERRRQRAEAACRRTLEISPHLDGVPVNVSARMLLGDILLEQGRPREALDTLLPAYRTSHDERLDLGVIIALCRLGDYRGALARYSDKYILNRYSGPAKPIRDLPVVTNIKTLEAAALLARGMRLGSLEPATSLKDFRRAEQLGLRCPLLALKCAMALTWLRQSKEALPRYRYAAEHGHDHVAAYARRMAESTEAVLARQEALTRENGRP